MHPEFDFDRAAGIASYLAELGVSHVYSSPVFESVEGSTHGYNVIDPNQVRGALGGGEGRARFIAALRANGLGLIADIVPNHLALSGNAWWNDVLRHGFGSRYFHYFDLDANADLDRAAAPVLLIPVLAEPYGVELEAGRIQLGVENSTPFVAYRSHRFPLSPRSEVAVTSVDEFNRNHQRLHALLEDQHYRLTWWRLARDESPYRRFFDINELIGIRVDKQDVFDVMHRAALEWVADGSVDGLRVDHIDGLADPGQYLERLRRRAPKVWIGVEKILAPGEDLPDWPVDGTTGYEFAALTTRLMTAAEAEGPLTAFYSKFTGLTERFDEVADQARREVLNHWLAGDGKRVALALQRVCHRSLRLRDYSLRDAQALVEELIAAMPVYRTYVGPGGASDADLAILASLCETAALRRPDLPAPLVAFVAGMFETGGIDDDERDFITRLQQLSTAVAAKAIEDTAFFRYNRWIALNEVGADPALVSITPADFHAAILKLQQRQPRGLRATSTHDAKRSEDVRARLTVLSECADLWIRMVERWGRRSDALRFDGMPDRNFEIYLYQTLVGAWPLSRQRAHAHAEKAVREAKAFTNWLLPSAEYERAVHHLVDALFDSGEFIDELTALVDSLHPADRTKSLTQQLLKLTVPGVPDLYQGTELWHLALSDPDNRTAVDYHHRRALLDECRRLTAPEVLERMHEGLPKLWVTARALALRARNADLANPESPYRPLTATGTHAGRVIAFQRGDSVAVVAPIRAWQVDWCHTTIGLPEGPWQHVLADTAVDGGDRSLRELFSHFPVALLERSAA